MFISSQPTTRSTDMFPSRSTLACLYLVTLFLGAGCGSGGGGGAQIDNPGDPSPGPHPFITDPNEGGRTTALRLEEVFWGRLVDVHDIDDDGNISSAPIFRDFVLRESLSGDGVNRELVKNPLTQRTRLILKRTRADDPEGFDREVSTMSRPLSPVLPRNDDGSSSPPFSTVARNAALILRFNDVLNDGLDVRRNLGNLVRVKTGYPPEAFFESRIFFDNHHGLVVDGAFHATRIIIDLTISEQDSLDFETPIVLNSIGLPASQLNSSDPNVSIRIPTRIDMGTGQFDILEAYSGAPIGTDPGEPTDRLSTTRDVVRAFRSGNEEDLNSGVMADFDSPEVVGTWPMTILQALDDPEGRAGLDFEIDMRFETMCRATPGVGDILQARHGVLLEVRNVGQAGPSGEIEGIGVQALVPDPVENPFTLVGGGAFQTTFRTNLAVPGACWIDVAPEPTHSPGVGISTATRFGLRFSEPMRIDSLTPFEGFMVVNGISDEPAQANNIVVGRVVPSDDRLSFLYFPALPLAHEQGQTETYSVRVQGPMDIAGNALATPLPFIDLHVDAGAETSQSYGTVFRFNELDEVAPIGLVDWRGQFLHDATDGRISPRPVTFFEAPVDESNPVPSVMVPFPRPIQTPLSSLGSRLQAVWRYADFGWQVEDEAYHNIDVVGLSWAPLNGLVIADYFSEFEMILSHSRRLPDAASNTANLPLHERSGLLGRNRLFTDNILDDPLSPPKIVHDRGLGYLIDSARLFVSPSGHILMPFPMNEGGGLLTSYLWRDTAILARGGPGGGGIPLTREVREPLLLDPGPPGRIARSGDVPSFGLPLLMEFKTYPDSNALGLNGFSISLATNSSAIPAFRAFSTGGTNEAGQRITRHPDLEDTPQGGFNPLTMPPGRRTRANDNGFYIGQMDFVTRVSRAHSAWIDTQLSAARFLDPVIQPPPGDQPAGTQVVVEYRGATGFNFDGIEDQSSPFNARALDPYGEMFRVDGNNRHQHVGEVRFFGDVETWSDEIRTASGARFFQVRLSFLSNISSERNADLSGLGFAYTEE